MNASQTSMNTVLLLERTRSVSFVTRCYIVSEFPDEYEKFYNTTYECHNCVYPRRSDCSWDTDRSPEVLDAIVEPRNYCVSFSVLRRRVELNASWLMTLDLCSVWMLDALLRSLVYDEQLRVRLDDDVGRT